VDFLSALSDDNDDKTGEIDVRQLSVKYEVVTDHSQSWRTGLKTLLKTLKVQFLNVFICCAIYERQRKA